MLPKLFYALSLLSYGSFAYAQSDSHSLANEFDYRQEISRGELAVGLEGAAMDSSSGSNLSGIGIRGAFDYSIGSGFSVSPGISVVSGNLSSFLYSGINAYLKYSILGDLIQSHQVLTRNGVPVYDQTYERANRLTVGLGAEQLFLNGTQSVYPAAGPSLEVSYEFTAWRRRFEIMARYSNLATNSNSLNGISIDFSFLLGL